MANKFKQYDKQFWVTHDNCYPTIETTINIGGAEYELMYYYENDIIEIAQFCDWHGDAKRYIDTSKFGSFAETRDTEYFTDNWDYATESVYQTYYTQPLDEYIEQCGLDEINDFVNEMLNEHGTHIINRSLINRFKRKWQQIKYYFRNPKELIK